MNMKTEITGSFPEIETAKSGDPHSGVKRVLAVAMTLWLGLIFVLGAQGAFVGKAGSPPLPIFFGFAIPLAVFFAAYFGWSSFRAFVLAADLRLLAAIQGWRWAGLGFLSLYAHHILPGLFAFPAGLGDMAVGFAAPWIVLGLIRHPSFATSRRHVLWNIMGIIDLVVAVSLGASNLFGLCPRTHRSGHLELDGAITPGAHPGVSRPDLHRVALHRPFPSATIGSFGKICVRPKHLNPPIGQPTEAWKAVMGQFLKWPGGLSRRATRLS